MKNYTRRRAIGVALAAAAAPAIAKADPFKDNCTDCQQHHQCRGGVCCNGVCCNDGNTHCADDGICRSNCGQDRRLTKVGGRDYCCVRTEECREHPRICIRDGGCRLAPAVCAATPNGDVEANNPGWCRGGKC